MRLIMSAVDVRCPWRLIMWKCDKAGWHYMWRMVWRAGVKEARGQDWPGAVRCGRHPHTDLFRNSLAKTGRGTGEQGVHPHCGSLDTGRKLTRPGQVALIRVTLTTWSQTVPELASVSEFWDKSQPSAYDTHTQWYTSCGAWGGSWTCPHQEPLCTLLHLDIFGTLLNRYRYNR